MALESHPDLEQEVAAAYAEYAGPLLRYAASVLRSREAARDAVQEVFLRYFAERRFGRCVENPRAWLYRVLHNYLLDLLDRTVNKWETAVIPPELRARGHNPEEIASRSQAARQIASTLTRRELDCLRLRADGLSYEEAAEALGVSAGTVSALLTRVHKKLRGSPEGDQPRPSSTAAALCYLFHGGNAYSP